MTAKRTNEAVMMEMVGADEGVDWNSEGKTLKIPRPYDKNTGKSYCNVNSGKEER